MTDRVLRSHREALLLHNGFVVWFTGLSGSGKTTIARTLEKRLHDERILTYVLDGDVLRKGLASDLTFSWEDRNENVRRASEVAALLADSGVVVICALMSPYVIRRQQARAIAGDSFMEVYIKCPIEECIKRDPKGLYAKFVAGEVKGMMGLDATYEEPEAPDIVVETDSCSIEECVDKIYESLYSKITSMD